MKASQMVEELQGMIKEYGDREVVMLEESRDIVGIVMSEEPSEDPFYIDVED